MPQECLRACGRVRNGHRRRQQRGRRHARGRREFPHVRIIRCENRGFAHANNRALLTSTARYALFLNVDTEVLDGTFGELVETLDERPSVGLAGVRQLSPGGEVAPTIRRFPSAIRSLGEALGSERFPFANGSASESSISGSTSASASATGHRDRSSAAAKPCRGPDSWTSDSSSTARSRISAAGSSRRDGRPASPCHDDHHAGRVGNDLEAVAGCLLAHAVRRKALFASTSSGVSGALALGNCARGRTWPRADEQRRAARAALRVLAGLDGPPFGAPPGQALVPSGRGRAEMTKEPEISVLIVNWNTRELTLACLDALPRGVGQRDQLRRDRRRQRLHRRLSGGARRTR